MIEVTDEMVAEGATAWMEVGGGSMREHLTAAYRAMRAREAPPHDRVERRPFRLHDEEETIPELRNRQAPPPPKAGDVGMRSEDQARGLTHQEMSENNEISAAIGAPLPPVGYGSGARTAAQLAAHGMANQPPIDRLAPLSRRLDALTALVLELARRSPGYPPGDATLQRLIAELENAK